MAQGESQALQVRLVLTVLQEQLEYKDPKDRQEYQEAQVPLAQQALQVHKDQ